MNRDEVKQLLKEGYERNKLKDALRKIDLHRISFSTIVELQEEILRETECITQL